PVNGDQVAAMWRDVDATLGAGVPAMADQSDVGQVAGGHRFTTTRWGDWVQKVAVDGMGHAWSGGDASASYTDARGPNASLLAWQFFSGSAAGAGGNGGSGGGSGSGSGGNPGTTPSMMHGGCAVAGVHASSASPLWIALGLLAARKRATSTSWTRSSGSTSSSPKRA
ncbi:MAG: hypothetical protein LC659_16080, partial [Myxococcales bacterium]|nr:hypothetical protein [Myxococcales bacterium]